MPSVGRQTMYKLHKRIALVASVALLAWLVSGIAMVIPEQWFRGSAQGSGGTSAAPPRTSPAPQPDFRAVQISIPEAIRALETALKREVQVTDLKMGRFEKSLVYHLTLRDGSVHLVDALSGQPVVITQAMAETMARRAGPRTSDIANTVLLQHRDFYYFGNPPVYKFTFNDRAGSVVYVSAATGEVKTIDWLGRLRRWIGSLHEFGPIHLISDSRDLRVGLLILFALITLGALCTGLYLALPRRSRSLAAIRQSVGD